jgi:hypothetical protein
VNEEQVGDPDVARAIAVVVGRLADAAKTR